MFPSPIPATNVSNPETAPLRLRVPVPVVVEVSLTLSFSFNAIETPYASLRIALLASAAGNEIVNVPLVDVLSPPKSRTTTALLEALLL